MHKEKGRGRALGLHPSFLETVYVFYFLLAFYFRIFNPRINKDIIIIMVKLCSAIYIIPVNSLVPGVH